jgi:metal-responsive CopG/Arc/MetJ family transcriptional regulator
MKTAISVPDSIFAEAERLARRMKTSRSELYSRALAEYIARHGSDQITESMNRALAAIGPQTDQFLMTTARRTLERSEW